MRKGFTLIELLFVLVIIGVIGTLGYQKYEEVTNKSKAQSLLRDVTFVKEALTEGYKLSNGVYQSCDSVPTKPEDPGSVTMEEENCGPDQSEWAMRVELAAREALEKKGFKFKAGSASGGGSSSGGSGEEMRLLSLPLVKVWFPPAINGVRVIRFEGVPGAIAVEALKTANGSLPTDKDGYVRSKPFFITKWDKEKMGKPSSSAGSGSSGDASADTAKAGLDAIVDPAQRLTDAKEIARSAKVDLYYVMTYPQGW